MQRFSFAVLVMIASMPAGAMAQTLTIEVEAAIDAPPPVAPPPRVVTRAAEQPVVVPSSPPVVVVRPLEDDPPPVVREDVPVPATPPVVIEPDAPEEQTDDGMLNYGALGGWAEQMNLSQLGLTFGDPEIRALRGVHLDASWAGNRALAGQTLGGVVLTSGRHWDGFFRGPEARFYVGGAEINGPWAAAPGADGFELQIQSAIVFRAEVALGLQLPLGPVTPYVMGRGAVGGAWIDVGVRDARLGELGTETLDAVMLELGIEAGATIRLGAGLELGAAFRGSFLGVESYGGVVTLGFDASHAED